VQVSQRLSRKGGHKKLGLGGGGRLRELDSIKRLPLVVGGGRISLLGWGGQKPESGRSRVQGDWTKGWGEGAGKDEKRKYRLQAVSGV